MLNIEKFNSNRNLLFITVKVKNQFIREEEVISEQDLAGAGAPVVFLIKLRKIFAILNCTQEKFRFKKNCGKGQKEGQEGKEKTKFQQDCALPS